MNTNKLNNLQKDLNNMIHDKQYPLYQEDDISILRCSTGYVIRTEDYSDIVKDLDSVIKIIKKFYE